MALFQRPAQFGNRQVDPVVNRKHRQGHDALRIGAGKILGEPVVVSPKAAQAQIAVLDGREAQRPSGIHHAGIDAVAILILEVLARVVIARQQV